MSIQISRLIQLQKQILFELVNSYFYHRFGATNTLLVLTFNLMTSRLIYIENGDFRMQRIKRITHKLALDVCARSFSMRRLLNIPKR